MVKVSKTVKSESGKGKTNKKNLPGKAGKDKLNKPGIYSFIAAFFVVQLGFWFIPDKEILRNYETDRLTFILIALLNGTLFFLPFFIKKQGLPEKIIKGIFFILLIAFILFDLIKNSETDVIENILTGKLNLYQNILVITLSVSGILTVLNHRILITKMIDSRFGTENKENETSSTKLLIKSLKFKKIETVFLFVLVLTSAILLYYRLDYFDLYSDESEVTQGAAGYFHSGEFKYWSFTEDKMLPQSENRAELHQFLVAQSYKLFGINPWASRFPSALAGIISVLLVYFFSRFMTRDLWFSLIISLCFAFYADYLLLFRWARMYAILIPLSIIAAYLGYRFLTGSLKERYKIFNQSKFLSLLDFNYFFFPFLLFILYVNLGIHQNSVVILPVLLVFSIFLFITLKEKKYLAISLLGLFLLILQFISPWEIDLSWFTFFKMKNDIIYNRFLFGYPFSVATSLGLLIPGASLVYFVNNNEFRKRMLFLVSMGLVGWILFSFIIDYPVSFRYISNLVLFMVILVAWIYLFLSKTLLKKYEYAFFIALLVLSVAFGFNRNFEKVYERNYESPAKPSVAWKSIIKNYQKGEIIYRHWGPAYYFDSINPAAKFLELGGYKGIPFKEVYDTLKKHDSGWLTWYTENDWRMDSSLRAYANFYFKKYNGFGLDSSFVEVFYYNKNMLIDSLKFKSDRMLPTANLNLQKNYSIAFWINNSERTRQSPFYIQSDSLIEINIQSDMNSVLCKYGIGDSVMAPLPADGNWHHVVWYQQVEGNNPKFGLVIDGKTAISGHFKIPVNHLAKFRINPFFKGNLDDLRIYDFPLTQKQVEIIMQNRGLANSEKLLSEGKAFQTLYHWQKK
ncbi:MAG: LamG-like jellyroll fold domain-containing protein [Bacteroidales bacterium]